MTNHFEENHQNQIVVHRGCCAKEPQESLRASMQITDGCIALIQHNLSLLLIASQGLWRDEF